MKPPTLELSVGINKTAGKQIAVFGVPGIGKTTLACGAPDPIILLIIC